MLSSMALHPLEIISTQPKWTPNHGIRFAMKLTRASGIWRPSLSQESSSSYLELGVHVRWEWVAIVEVNTRVSGVSVLESASCDHTQVRERPQQANHPPEH